jgi:hypothetical protein
MLAPDQGMVPDVSVFSSREKSQRATYSSEPRAVGAQEAGERAIPAAGEAEAMVAGDLGDTGERSEVEAAQEPEWVEQVCCHIEVMVAGAGERV